MTTLQLLHVHMCGQLDLLVCCSNLPCTDTASAILCTVLAILSLSTTLSSKPAYSTLPHPTMVLPHSREKKKTLRFSHDSNIDRLNAGQMLLPTEPLGLWY